VTPSQQAVVYTDGCALQSAQKRMFQGRNREQRDLLHDEHHPGGGSNPMNQPSPCKELNVFPDLVPL
jgi:hypothetical protein